VKVLKKYNIFAGHYGSGKTEIAINTVLCLAKEGKKTILVDMDIVNPYFRSSEKEKMLESRGIRVIKPCYANTMVDVPSLPSEIYSPFTQGECDAAVFDAGGDPVGAAALGMLKDYFDENLENTEFYCVINTLRPMQQSAEEIMDMMREIENKSKLKLTALIHNTNLARKTRTEDVISGQQIVEEVSKKTGLPITAVYAMEDIADEVKKGITGIPVVPLKLRMRPEWLDETT